MMNRPEIAEVEDRTETRRTFRTLWKACSRQAEETKKWVFPLNSLLFKMALETVSFPLKNCEIPWLRQCTRGYDDLSNISRSLDIQPGFPA